MEMRRLQDLQREDEKKREEQLEKARVRGKCALKREQLELVQVTCFLTDDLLECCLPLLMQDNHCYHPCNRYICSIYTERDCPKSDSNLITNMNMLNVLYLKGC